MSADGAEAVADRNALLSVQRQIEFYFSKSNLLQDKFMQQHMDRKGFVELDLIANFPKLTKLAAACVAKTGTSAVDAVRQAAQASSQLVVGTSIAGKTAIRSSQSLLDMRDDSLGRKVYIDSLHQGLLDHDALKSALEAEFGKVLHVSLPRDKRTRKFKGFAFVEFETTSAADAAAAAHSVKGMDIKSKKEWLRLKGVYSSLIGSSLPRVGPAKRAVNGPSKRTASGPNLSAAKRSRGPRATPLEERQGTDVSTTEAKAPIAGDAQPTSSGPAIQPGSFLCLRSLGNTATRKAIRTACQVAAPVAYVDYDEKAGKEAIVRFKTRIGARLALRHFKNHKIAISANGPAAVASKLDPALEAKCLEDARREQEQFFERQRQKKRKKLGSAVVT